VLRAAGIALAALTAAPNGLEYAAIYGGSILLVQVALVVFNVAQWVSTRVIGPCLRVVFTPVGLCLRCVRAVGKWCGCDRAVACLVRTFCCCCARCCLPTPAAGRPHK